MAVAFLFFRLHSFFFPCRTQRVTSADNKGLYGIIRHNTLHHYLGWNVVHVTDDMHTVYVHSCFWKTIPGAAVRGGVFPFRLPQSILPVPLWSDSSTVGKTCNVNNCTNIHTCTCNILTYLYLIKNVTSQIKCSLSHSTVKHLLCHLECESSKLATQVHYISIHYCKATGKEHINIL